MVSTPSTLTRLELQTTGENVNVWGTKLNTLFELIEQAIYSGAEIDIPVEGNITLTATNYIANQERRGVLRFTGTGGHTVTFSGKARKYLIVNDCAGTITLSDGGTTVSIEAGERDIAITDGTDFELMGFSTLNTQLADYLLKTGGAISGNLTVGGTFGLTGAGTFASLLNYTSDLSGSYTDRSLVDKAYVNAVALGTVSVSVQWSDLLGKPTTISGFAITDAYTETEVDGLIAGRQPLDSDLTAIAALATSAAGREQLILNRRNVTAANSPVTADYGDDISCDTSGGAITINLPAAVAGRAPIIIRAGADAATNNVTLEPDGSETILGESNLVIDLNFFAYSFAAKAGAWV